MINTNDNLHGSSQAKSASLSSALTALINQQPELLSTPDRSFPLGLWQRLAEKNILTPRLSSLQHEACSYAAIADAARLMTQYSGLPGLAMSWLMQQLLIEIITRSDSLLIKEKYLPELLAGKTLCALSISEPKAGAHPKYLTTRADKTEAGYVLNGEKTYVTNGPNAGIFIILAISSVINERKQFTAFLVPADSKGLSIKPMQGFDALSPTTHCGLVLQNCEVPASCVLGEIGSAFDSISKPFRELEDILMLSPLAGAMQSLIDELRQLKEGVLTHEQLGQLLAISDSVAFIGLQAAAQLDKTDHDVSPASLIITGKLLTEKFINKVKELTTGLPLNERISSLINDIDVLVNIAKSANLAKQITLAKQYLDKE